MTNKHNNGGVKPQTAFFALLIIFAGILLLLANIGVLPYHFKRVFLSWQMLLIAIGIYNLFSSKHKTGGIILIVVGGVFLYDKFYPFCFNAWSIVWPVILIILGAAMLVRHTRKPLPGYDGVNINDTGNQEGENINVIDELNIFGSSERTITGKNFRGGKITNIFGGSEINLMKTELSDGYNVVSLFCLFGGTTLIIPSGWEVVTDVTAVFGEFSDKRVLAGGPDTNPEKRLYIKGLVLFGGGEVKTVPQG